MKDHPVYTKESAPYVTDALLHQIYLALIAASAYVDKMMEVIKEVHASTEDLPEDYARTIAIIDDLLANIWEGVIGDRMAEAMERKGKPNGRK